eukprot:CAMPEP_0173433410 /NCGR_PEP_ID=MMETSP1357-20121228/10868_1 /TAXON_ID=77926 /ORGANISM="Hemiselmis rufescens, Strain PCC563" /LENGTH=210 /DNA_ID=CAMNT_0014398107 /DNA_START=39 /DNA_END=671 /DNA_ORIENTATION=+
MVVEGSPLAKTPSSPSTHEGKRYLSYNQIHKTVASLADAIREYKPDCMVAIGGGGFIPARMLRTFVKVPILTVSLELYDDATNTRKEKPVKLQWFDSVSGVGERVEGKRVLVVDEVDDSRTTLQFCVEEILRDHTPAEMAVMVLHNKEKPKNGVLPKSVSYYAGESFPDVWCVYPWDATDIDDHERKAKLCEESSFTNRVSSTPLIITSS